MTLRNYTIGFIASLLLTAASFGIVAEHYATGHQFPSHAVLLGGILFLAVVQLCVQMAYFLHIGRGSKARDLVALGLALAIIFLIVGGSLWIMANLADSHRIPYQGTVAPQDEQ